MSPEPVAPRVLGLVHGNPESAMSGVAARLLGSLQAAGLPVVGAIDYAPRGPRRIALAAATFRPGRAAWRGRFYTSPLAHRTLSATLADRLGSRPQPGGDFDVALQVHGWVAGQPRPYVLYVDQTRLMAERGWPRWLPMTDRERPGVLERERRMYDRAAHILVMGAPARESLIADYGIDPARITIAGGGLMFDAPDVLDSPEREPASHDPAITFVGREFERKGGDTLLAAFALVRAEIRRVKLHIVGPTGRARRSDTPGVVWHGRINDREQMSAIYRRSAVFCMPSCYEPYGFVFAEAMAHGIPCIGTSVQSIPEILDHGRSGLLVPPGAPDALAEALLAVLCDPELASRLARAGRERVHTELLWEHVAARAVPVLEEAAGASQPVAAAASSDR